MNSFWSEFLFSAVLWGSLLTALLWTLRRRSARVSHRRLLAIPLLWIGAHTAFAWYGLLLPVSGRLVDADTGAPIANARVVSTWHSYPLGLWTSYCSGRQAHLTDAEGRFAFRFVPLPSLFAGTMLRGINPRVPGRINHRTLNTFPAPVLGDVEIQPYAAGRSVSRTGPNTECRAAFAPQYAGTAELPGELHPFDAMYREACVERRPWTLTDIFLTEMMMRRPKSATSTAPPAQIQAGLAELAGYGCEEGICVRAVPEETRAMFCEYYGSVRSPSEVKE